MANNVRAGGAYVELFTKDSALISGLNAASRRLKSFGTTVTGVGKKMSAVGALASGALGGAVLRYANAGSAIEDAAQRTGMSAEAFSSLAFAAKMAGVDASQLEHHIAKLNEHVGDLAKGGSGAQKTFAHLGLSFANLRGLSPDQQFALIADRLQKIPSQALRTAIATEIFGKSAADLLPMLAGGAAGLEEMRAEAERLGLVMSAEDAAAAEKFGDTLDKLFAALDSVYRAIGKSLALTELAEIFTGASVGIRRWVDENQELVVIAAAGVAAFTSLGGALLVLGPIITAVGMSLGALATTLGLIGSIIGFLISPIGLLIGGLAAVSVTVWQTSDASGKAIQWFSEQFGALQEDSLSAFRAISDALAAGDIETAAEVLWSYLGTVWQAGKVLIYEITNELTNSLIDLWFNASTKLVTTAIEIGGAIGDAFAAAGDFIRSIWTRIFAWLEDKYYIISGFLQKLFAGFDEAESRKIDAQTAESRKVAADANAAAAASGTDMQTRQAERQRTIAGVESAMAASRDAFGNPLQLDTAAARSELTTRRDAFRAAADAVPTRDAAAAGPEKPKLAPPDMEAVKQAAKMSTTGTFSAQAVGGIGGPAERTAQNTEEMKRTLRRMEENGMGAFA